MSPSPLPIPAGKVTIEEIYQMAADMGFPMNRPMFNRLFNDITFESHPLDRRYRLYVLTDVVDVFVANSYPVDDPIWLPYTENHEAVRA